MLGCDELFERLGATSGSQNCDTCACSTPCNDYAAKAQLALSLDNFWGGGDATWESIGRKLLEKETFFWRVAAYNEVHFMVASFRLRSFV